MMRGTIIGHEAGKLPSHDPSAIYCELGQDVDVRHRRMTVQVWRELALQDVDLLTLADDSLIDAYHQAWEDHRDAGAEDSDNLDKACAESLATRKAMQGRFPDYQRRYEARYP